MRDFSPLFVGIRGWEAGAALTEFVSAANTLSRHLDQIFTVNSLFGRPLLDIYQDLIYSSTFIERSQLGNTSVNFRKVNFKFSIL